MTKNANSTRGSQFLNKNSAYIQSLVSFILDTKPYHCKLTETIEEYQFSDEMFVKMEERLYWRSKLDGVWMYDYYSSANPNLRATKISRLVSYLFNQEPFIVGADENKDLALVPFVYSKKYHDGPSVASVKIERADASIEPLTETVDWFESLGAFEFQVQQTFQGVPGAPNSKFNPLWQSTMDQSVIQEARKTLRESALDVNNPTSNVNLIRAEMDQIRDITLQFGTLDPNAPPASSSAIFKELDLIYEILDEPWLPYAYNDLFIAIEDDPPVSEQIDMEALKQRLAFLTPRLFFGVETDNNFREGGLVSYRPLSTPYMRIFNIVPDVYADYEQWTVECVNPASQSFVVRGSIYGYAGSFTAGSNFSLPGHIRFSTTKLANDAIVGDSFTLSPANRIVIHPKAKLETWNLIKTNPLAFNRPVLESKSYGTIVNLQNKPGEISLLVPTIPTSTFVITAISSTTFNVTNDVLPSYQKRATVDTVFNDGTIGFTIKNGTRRFQAGDKFIIAVNNDPARVADTSISFGYDMDAYDNEHLAYANGVPINFAFGTRYPVFDEAQLRINVSETSIHGRKWRFSALTDKSRPITTVKKDKTTSTAAVDLDDATSGNAPDPSLTAKPRFSNDGTRETAPYADADLILYYANNFKMEYSDDDGESWNFVRNVNIDTSYNIPEYGISFIIPTLDKPYIVADAFMGPGVARYQSGDIITFTITNPDPHQTQRYVGLTSIHAPRLEPHAAGFYYTRDAAWTVKIKSSTTYTVESVQLSGPDIGKPLPGTPVTGTIPYLDAGAREGFSFKNQYVEFTIVPNAGLTVGDTFTFETWEDYDTFVVHGSVSGYTGTAKVGQYYWNGSIGFTISPPGYFATTSDGKPFEDKSLINVERLRVDHKPEQYTFTRTPTGDWNVTNDRHGSVKFVKWGGTLETDVIKVKVSNSSALNALVPIGSFFHLNITPDSHELFQPSSLVIIKPPSTYQYPKIGERVWVVKTVDSHLNIALDPDYGDLGNLMLENIDPRLINIDTVIGDETLLEVNPELSVLRGFIPMSVTRKDSQTSPAEFYDPATIFEYYSTATGEKVGVSKPLDRTDINRTFMFEWDLDFFTKYLPINGSASFITQNGGWADKMHVQMEESAKFLLGNSGTDQDFLFEEAMLIDPIEQMNWDISVKFENVSNVTISDAPYMSPFNGVDIFTFVPGFDTPEYDSPLGYDAGRTFALDSLIYDGQTEESRNMALLLWNPYLRDGYKLPTTYANEDYMLQQLANDPNPGGLSNLFGIPYSGMAMDFDQSSNTELGMTAEEDTQIRIRDHGNPHDEYGYDTLPLDLPDEISLRISPFDMPPYAPVDYNVGMTWDEYAAPIESLIDASVFVIEYPRNTPANLIYRVWVEGTPQPQIVAVVLPTGRKSVRFSIPRPSKIKLSIT